MIWADDGRLQDLSTCTSYVNPCETHARLHACDEEKDNEEAVAEEKPPDGKDAVVEEAPAIGGTTAEFLVGSNVLSACSPVLCTMLKGNCPESRDLERRIKLPQFTPAQFEHFMHLVHAEHLKAHWSDVCGFVERDMT
jgi:hypothetical protein